MPKYVTFFSYTPEAWSRMIQNPGDRAEAGRRLFESLGGSLEALYFMFGERDGFAIFDVPDAESAAAGAITVASSGAFKHLQTHELIAPEDLGGILQKAQTALGEYTPPGG